jgi:predicted esterase
MEEANVDFQFKARYHKLGTLDSNTKQVWIVLHGYGQLARFFIKKFEILVPEGICIIAPEGLSRFYLSDLTEKGRPDNKVGATWMTQENRLMDIENYLAYLDMVYRKELSARPNVRVTLLGFSQGSATACRWVTHGVKFEKLILWAGLFPPDMDFREGHQILAAKKTYLVVGDQDPYLTDERMNEFDDLSRKLGIAPEKIVFNGKHEIHERTLLQLIGSKN